MRIFLGELKKIWRPSLLIIMVAFSLVFFRMYCNRYCNYPHFGFGNNTVDTNTWPGYLVITEMLEEYGPALEPEERLDTEKYIEEYCRKLDPFVQGKAEYEKEGIFSGRDLWDFSEGKGKFEAEFEAAKRDEHAKDSWKAKQRELVDPLTFGDPYAPDGGPVLVATDYAMGKLQFINSVFNSWDRFYSGEMEERVEYMENRGYAERIKYLIESKEYQNIFYKRITDHTGTYYAYGAVLMLISNFILLLPYMVRDRVSGILPLQCSGRAGRKMLKTQFFAAMSSTLTLAAFQLALLTFLFFWKNDFSMFFHLKIGGAITVELFLFNMTYFQCLCLILLLLLVLTLAAGILFFAFSHLSREYISALAKSLPILGGLCLVGYNIPEKFLYAVNDIYQFLHLWVEGAEIYLPAVILLLSGILFVILYKRWKRADI